MSAKAPFLFRTTTGRYFVDCFLIFFLSYNIANRSLIITEVLIRQQRFFSSNILPTCNYYQRQLQFILHLAIVVDLNCTLCVAAVYFLYLYPAETSSSREPHHINSYQNFLLHLLLSPIRELIVLLMLTLGHNCLLCSDGISLTTANV